jgi:hypothetical protein
MCSLLAQNPAVCELPMSQLFYELVSINNKDNEYTASRVTHEMIMKGFGRKQPWPNEVLSQNLPEATVENL